VRLPSVYCVVTFEIPGPLRSRLTANLEGLVSPCEATAAWPSAEVRPSGRTESGNGGRRYRQKGVFSKEATATALFDPPLRPGRGLAQVGSTPASGPAMSS
jgi:hypothetical protein